MNYEAIKEILFEEAGKRGLSDFDVYCTKSTDLSASALNREPSATSYGTAGGVCFRCAVEGKMGSAATECMEEAELRALVTRAKENAAVVDADEEPVFYTPAPTDVYGEVSAKKVPLPDMATLRHTAMDLQEKLYTASSLVTDGTETSAGALEAGVALFNSGGLSLCHSATMQYAYAEAVIQKEGEPSYGTAITSNVGDLTIADKALTEATERLGASHLATGKYRVVFSPKQVRALLSTYSSIFSGKSALLGLSLLKGKEDTEIASPVLSLYDDPFYEGNTMQMPFDAEGVPTKRKALIEKGVLKTLLYDLKNAKKAGVESTGNAVRASYADGVGVRPFCLCVSAGSHTQEALFREAGEGIYITELKGLHSGADAVTGDFSIESAGFLIKDGKRAGAVRGFTVAGNFYSLLRSVVAVGSEVEMGLSGVSMTAAPALLISELSVAGESEKAP